MAAYDATCFDLDGTLCEPTRHAEDVLETAFQRAGLEPFCTWPERTPSLSGSNSDELSLLRV